MEFTELRSQDARTETYLGGPSIVLLLSGDLLATHTYFGPGSSRSLEHEEHLTSVYRSSDGGATWTNVNHVGNAFWSSLFVHQGCVHMIGCSQKFGSIVIRRSEDEGFTWTTPVDARSGLLFQGGYFHQPPNYHCGPVPVLRKNGRLYRAFENCSPCAWGRGFRAFVISCAEDDDLLNAVSWTASNELPFEQSWVPDDCGMPEGAGWLEGNVVETPTGDIWNILRLHSTPYVDKAAVIHVHDEGRRISFDPATGIIDFPGGHSKFTIQRDPVTGLYLTLSNSATDPRWPEKRNILSLQASEDLLHWRRVMNVLEDDSGLSPRKSAKRVGFQYADWQFDGDDLIYLVQTAYDGAHDMHDANRISFHRLRGFREHLAQERSKASREHGPPGTHHKAKKAKPAGRGKRH